MHLDGTRAVMCLDSGPGQIEPYALLLFTALPLPEFFLVLKPLLLPLAEKLSMLHIFKLPLQSLVVALGSLVLVLTLFGLPLLVDAVSDTRIDGVVAPGNRHGRRAEGERGEAGYHDYSPSGPPILFGK